MPAHLGSRNIVFSTHALAESESKVSIIRLLAKKLKVDEFRIFLSRRLPLVITGLNNSLQLPWSPSHLIAEYGKQPCTMEDCEGLSEPLQVVLEDFLTFFSPDRLGESSLHPSAIWKVKVGILQSGQKFSHLINTRIGQRQLT